MTSSDRAAETDAGRAAKIIATVLATTERRYVEALNAVLCSAVDSADVERWRGHAEAYRQTATTIRSTAGLDGADYRGSEWRAANGVYTTEQLAEMRR